MSETKIFEDDFDELYQNKNDTKDEHYEHDQFIRDEYPEEYTMDRENPEGESNLLETYELTLAVESGFDLLDSGNW